MPTNCPKTKATCKNSAIVKSVKKLINQLESDNMTDFIPITKKEINQIRRALDTYMRECKICAQYTGNSYLCLKAAIENLQRRIPIFSKDIYPWKNYDWDYSNHITNNYSKERTGARVGSGIRDLYANVLAIIKIINGFIDDPIPGPRSRAGIRSKYSDYPKFEDCDSKCQYTQKVKNSLANTLYRPPTTDRFLRKKLHGKYSSSYFVKIGSCPRRDIDNITDCEKRGYIWTPNILDKVMNKMKKNNKNLVKNESGSCSQPRYLFIDNSPKPFLNGSNMKGMIPSIANDIMALSPEKLLNAAQGKSMTGNFEIQQCPKSGMEGYVNYKSGDKSNPILSKFNLTLILMLIIVYLFLKQTSKK